MPKPVIFWYRQDLRIDDLPGLSAAAATGRPLVMCYVLDEVSPGELATGAASQWWLHHSLAALTAQLEHEGGRLLLLTGSARDALTELARAVDAEAVYCSRCYEPWAAELEKDLHDTLQEDGVAFKRYPGSLLFEPETVETQSGGPFKVFTPFWKACMQKEVPSPVSSVRDALSFYRNTPDGLSLESFALTPKNPDWAAGWDSLWEPGAEGARKTLQQFLQNSLDDYARGRDHPHLNATSHLSPHLHFGEVSPRQVWHAVQAHCEGKRALVEQRRKFLSELGWREFCYHLLHHFPTLPEAPFKTQFRDFPWLGNARHLRAWQRGRTGYPIVDAGMRELWHTGYMHNRVRMIVASFLTKHLLLHWQRGEAWFRDTLVDADLANNVCGWQWVAGSGADAAPYFRIFNPTLQGKKFDAGGDYVRRWVPEIEALPDKYIHEPAAAPDEVLAQAGIRLGDTYPAPIVEHKAAREAALAAYDEVKQS